jgi:transcriptional regulator with XRE-family HTH domain
MRDNPNMAMLTPVDGAEALPMPPDEPAWEAQPILASALKESRGDRSQSEVAQAAGISQGFLSELERGRKRLTPGTAGKLAPVLGIMPDQLIVAEHWVKLQRAAREGGADPKSMLAATKTLAEMLPSGRVGDDLVDALVAIVREKRQKLLM